jgi:hypothetical protein
MPPRGRPPQPGTAEEKAAVRREKVRLYVKAHRERKKNAASLPLSSETSFSEPNLSSSPDSVTRSNSIDSEFGESCKVKSDPYDAPVKEKTENDDDEVVPDGQLIRVSGNTTTTAQRKSISLIMPRGGKEFAMALMGTFRTQFLPDTVRVPGRQDLGSELVTPCSAWITNAYGIALRQDSGALKSGILAVGLALTSMQYQDERLRMASLDVYRKTLRQVRTDLKPLETGRATNYLVPYLSCLAAAMFEMVHDGFSENIMQHVKGAISLMELLPRDKSINHLLSDLLLEDLCMWEIVFALKYRYPSPLRDRRKRKGNRGYKVDGNGDSASQNATVLGDLLDGADEIPAVMFRVDQLRLEPFSSLKHREIDQELSKLARILSDLDAWALRFQERFSPIYIQDEGATDFKGKERSSVRFVSYEVAAAWVYYLTFTLCGLETNIEALTEIIHDHHRLSSALLEANDMSLSHRITLQTMPERRPRSEYDDFTRATHNRAEATYTEFSEIGLLYKNLDDLRIKLRWDTLQLIEAMCIFLPIPKGIIGQSLVLFPLDRCKAILKKELARLQLDQKLMKGSASQDDEEILLNIEQLSQAMTVYDSLEQTLAQTGMPTMPED